MNPNTPTKRVMWMMDESIANASPKDWEEVSSHLQKLIALIGNPRYSHELVDPVSCLDSLTIQLKGKDFSSIIDLTGWLTPTLQELFPYTQIENSFSLSRVRVVSSVNLSTSGYVVSKNPEEIDEIREHMDLRAPLIVDDTSFSGSTNKMLMQLWKLDPTQTTHAFLIGNTGTLGVNQKGAVPTLEEEGSTVFYGHELRTPEDDGWHTKDLYDHPNVLSAFNLVVNHQQNIAETETTSARTDEFFLDPEVNQILFPQSLSSETIDHMADQGYFKLTAANNSGTVHTRNPFLWTIPDFLRHIDLNQVLLYRDDISHILSELNRLSSDPEGKKEASLEFKRYLTQERIAREKESFSTRKEI